MESTPHAHIDAVNEMDKCEECGSTEYEKKLQIEDFHTRCLTMCRQCRKIRDDREIIIHSIQPYIKTLHELQGLKTKIIKKYEEIIMANMKMIDDMIKEAEARIKYQQERNLFLERYCFNYENESHELQYLEHIHNSFLKLEKICNDPTSNEIILKNSINEFGKAESIKKKNETPNNQTSNFSIKES